MGNLNLSDYHRLTILSHVEPCLLIPRLEFRWGAGAEPRGERYPAPWSRRSLPWPAPAIVFGQPQLGAQNVGGGSRSEPQSLVEGALMTVSTRPQGAAELPFDCRPADADRVLSGKARRLRFVA